MTPTPPPAVRLVVAAPRAMQTTMARWAGSRGAVSLVDLGEAADASVFVDPDGAAAEAAADDAEALVVDFHGIDHLEQVAARVRAALAARDRTIDELRIVVRLAVVAAPTFGAAEELADRLELEGCAREHAVVGSFDAVAAVLARLARHGAVDAIDLSPVVADGEPSDAAVLALVAGVVPRLSALVSLPEPVRRSGGARAALGLPTAPRRRAGVRVPFAAFETEVPAGF